jgi:hypothetical protein
MQNFICVQLHPIHMNFSTLDPRPYLAYSQNPFKLFSNIKNIPFFRLNQGLWAQI